MTTSDQPETSKERTPVSILKCRHCGASNRIGASPKGAPHCGACGKPLAWVVNASETTFEAEVRASPTVVVDLWAPWCGPCRIVSPMLDEFAGEFAGRIKVVKVNVDENLALSMRFEARSIPTLVVLLDGKVVDRIVGALPKTALAARLTPHLKPPRAPSADAT